MTLAELAAIDLDERAYCLVVAAARRSRPRMSPRIALEKLIAAIEADRREVSKLLCSRCEAVTLHVHDRDVTDELAGQVVRIWRCGCGCERQCGAWCATCGPDACRCEPRSSA